ncbi:MAG TPA: hypothetical protein VN289_24620, partial [Paraburkholderia sp.]|nr:hypothetical protein [Paraburkholderia sp.]
HKAPIIRCQSIYYGENSMSTITKEQEKKIADAACAYAYAYVRADAHARAHARAHAAAHAAYAYARAAYAYADAYADAERALAESRSVRASGRTD